MPSPPPEPATYTQLRKEHLLALGVAYIVCSADLHITSASATVANLLGIPGTDIRGQLLTEVCLPLIGSEEKLAAIRAGTVPDLVIEQINIEQAAATTRYISLVVLPHHPGLLVIISDVTVQSVQQQRLQQQHYELLLLHEKVAEQNKQLAELNAELARLSQRKSDMIAIVTHDLRSPLTAIIGYARMILDGTYGPTTPDQRELLQSIQSQGQHMRDLLSRLLDLRRLEAAELQNRTTVNLNLLVMRVVFSFHDHARLAGVALQHPEADDMITLLGDGDILQQAIANLVSNAIKYTGRGGSVMVRLYRCSELPALNPPLAPGCWCAIEVSDTGLGIDEHDLQRIFDPFYRTAEAQIKGLAGSGLGLAIVQMAMRQHSGRVLVDSRVGEGTTFTLLVPCSPPEEPRLPTA